jgi:type IV pilus assembly protein PilV
MMKKITKQRGATLIEIMVSILVMAIGLLGLASLQINAMKFQKTSSQRSEATQAAADLGERMRSNWKVTTKDATAQTMINDLSTNKANYTYEEEYLTSSGASHVPPNNCKTANCNESQIAANDKKIWAGELQRRLVGGAGFVTPVVGTTYPTFIITVMWRETTFNELDPSCPAGAKAPVGVRCYNLNYTI